MKKIDKIEVNGEEYELLASSASEFVSYNQQALTSAQMEQARKNIDAVSPSKVKDALAVLDQYVKTEDLSSAIDKLNHYLTYNNETTNEYIDGRIDAKVQRIDENDINIITGET